MEMNGKIEMTESKFAHFSISDMFEDQLLQSILTLVQDGICFLSTEMEVLYANPAMRFWYGESHAIGKKCYEVYHGRKEPCEKCPVLKSLQSNIPEVEEAIYEKSGKRMGWQRVFSMPIHDRNGKILMFIEYVRDITNERKSNLSKELLQSQLNSLMDIMTQKEEERKLQKQKFLKNIDKSIDSVLGYLNECLDTDSYNLVENQLNLTYMGVEHQDVLSGKFSGQELAVARYVAEGYMSKEIADKLNISKKTVDYYRTNIRKKMNLRPEENLKSKLQQLSIDLN